MGIRQDKQNWECQLGEAQDLQRRHETQAARALKREKVLEEEKQQLKETNRRLEAESKALTFDRTALLESNQQMITDVQMLLATEERLKQLKFQYEKVVDFNTKLNADLDAQVIIIDNEKKVAQE